MIGLSIKEELICPPPPSKADLFGIVDNIKSEYEEQTEKMMKQSKETQARMEFDLQKKIAARRQRRARMKIEEKETETFKAPEGKSKTAHQPSYRCTLEMQ